MTRLAIAHALAALAVASALLWASAAGENGISTADAAVGTLFAVLAVACLLRPRYRGAGAVAALAAVLWFAGEWDGLQWLHRGAIAWLVLAYPGVRLRPRWGIAVVAGAAVAGAVPALASSSALTVTLALAVAGTVASRLRTTPRIARRPVAAAVVAAGVLAAAWTVPVALRAAGMPDEWALVVYLVGTGYVAVLLLIDVTLDRSPESALVGVVIDLGGVTDTGTLRDRLARVIGDPQLWLGYRLADGRYVDDAGIGVTQGQPASDRVITAIDDDGRRVAVLAHDQAIHVDPALLPEIAAAASLALRNVELHADVRARVIEIENSRDRLLLAENEARRGFGADIQSGPRRRLERVAGLVGRLSGVAELAVATARADAALESFGRGLRPAELDDDLDASLARLGADLPFAIEVHTEVSALAPEYRDAVWFICAEALTNTAKHAGAEHVIVRLEQGAEDAVVLTVQDDGGGGAAIDAGTGLRGLRERARQLGGTLEVQSPAGGGTTVRALLPNAAVPAASGSR